MSRPQLHRRYRATTTRPAVEFHLQGCACEHCQPVPPPLPIVRLTFAAIAVANGIAFAWDPHGAWNALAATLTARF